MTDAEILRRGHELAQQVNARGALACGPAIDSKAFGRLIVWLIALL